MENPPFTAPELKKSLEHDAARKEVEGAHHRRPATDSDAIPMSYPPWVKALRLKHGEVAALIWDRGGHCVETWLKEGEAQPRRLELASRFVASWTRNTVPLEPEAQRRECRLALDLADMLISEAAKP
jgi:hypothetical protein